MQHEIRTNTYVVSINNTIELIEILDIWLGFIKKIFLPLALKFTQRLKVLFS